jgi:hypothetical protein
LIDGEEVQGRTSIDDRAIHAGSAFLDLMALAINIGRVEDFV